MSSTILELTTISTPLNAWFYGTADGLDYKVRAGVALGLATLGADGKLEASQRSGDVPGFTSSLATGAPNDIKNVSAMIPTGGTTNQVGVFGQKGNGAICAKIPDGTVTGGNVRGSYAVDWQISREVANQVASASYSAILSGQSNLASDEYSMVVGGYDNRVLSLHGVIVGGDNNQIAESADHNFIGAGRSNTHATGSWICVISGGQGNQTSGSATYATIAGGLGNVVSKNYGSITGGNSNTVSGEASRAGGAYSTDRGVSGSDVFAAGRFAANGDAQVRKVLLRSDTSDDTTEPATSTNAAASGINQLLLADNSSAFVNGTVVVRENSTGDCACFTFRSLARRGVGAATTVVVGQNVTQDYADAGAATWAVAVVADTTNGAVRINVTGEDAHSLRWVVEMKAVEVVG